MLFSIGYLGLTPQQLIDALQEYDTELLIDVRSSPRSKFPAFNSENIAPILIENEIEYKWHGDRLGGRSKIEDSALVSLIEIQREKVVCIMCMESVIKNCHRYYEIGQRLLNNHAIEVSHIKVKPPKKLKNTLSEERRIIQPVPICSIVLNTGDQTQLL